MEDASQPKPEEEFSSDAWEMTNPKDHDPKHFRYIVYGALDMRGMPNLRADLDPQEFIHDLHKEGGVNRLISRDILSTSVIDQDHRGTYGNDGLILDVPQENIIQALHKDSATVMYPKTYKDFVREGRTVGRLPPASEILADTGTTIYPYNEVDIHPTNPRTKEQIKVTGVFIIINPETGKPINPVSADEALKLARELKVPVVEIPKQRKFKYDIDHPRD